jgi:hypothetical protein
MLRSGSGILASAASTSPSPSVFFAVDLGVFLVSSFGLMEISFNTGNG